MILTFGIGLIYVLGRIIFFLIHNSVLKMNFYSKVNKMVTNLNYKVLKRKIFLLSIVF